MSEFRHRLYHDGDESARPTAATGGELTMTERQPDERDHDPDEDDEWDVGSDDFFLQWICGYDPVTGLCALAGTEECDWECPL